MALWRRRLAWQAGALNADPLGVDSSVLLFCLLRDLGDVPEEDARALAGLTADGARVPARRPVPEDAALRYSFPDWMAALLTPPLMDALNLPGPVTLRVNTLLTTRAALAQRLLAQGLQTHPGDHADTALHIDTPRPNIFGLPEHQAGLFEVQDEGSQLLGALVDAQPGEAILDLCAGAGGKSLQLAAQLRNQGTLHVFDSDLSRLERLETRARRARVRCHIVHRAAPPASLQVDRALVDAPCSELGPLRRGPDVRFRLQPETFSGLPSLQRALLEQALSHLRPRGRLVYATCTLRPEENDATARDFEAAHPELRRLRPPVDATFVTADDFFRALPHRHGTDGFFAAVWERAATGHL